MAVDPGNQIVSVIYNAPVDSHVVNKLNVDIIPRGVYSGGYFTMGGDPSSDTGVATIDPFVCIVQDTSGVSSIDGTTQVRVETTTSTEVTGITTNDYLVVRWAYVTNAANSFASVLAVASGELLADDVILGQATGGTGVSYTAKTVPQNLDLFLRVEEKSSLAVRVRGGRISTGAATSFITDSNTAYPLEPASSGFERVDLIAVNNNGAIEVVEGTESESTAVAPTYGGRMVLAEVTVDDTEITEILDTRSATKPPSLPDEVTIGFDGSSKLEVVDNGITVDKLSLTLQGLIPKAWVAFNASSGVISDVTGFGYSNVVRNSVGDYTVTWSTPFLTAQYALAFSAGGHATQNVWSPLLKYGANSKTTTECTFIVFHHTGSYTDCPYVSVIAYGRQ